MTRLGGRYAPGDRVRFRWFPGVTGTVRSFVDEQTPEPTYHVQVDVDVMDMRAGDVAPIAERELAPIAFARAPAHLVATHETVDARSRRIRFNASELARLRATDTDPDHPKWIRVDPWTLPERFVVGCAWRVRDVVEACERGPCGVRRIGAPW